MAYALARKERPLLHLVLLVLTLLSTFGTFLWDPYRLGTLPERLVGALAFSLSLVVILGSHEMGHYLLARLHGVDASLPYFIPAPFGMGTLGAVIRIRGRIPSRNALVDIGAAGPLAGVLVALPILIYGLFHSPLRTLAPASTFPGQLSLWRVAPVVFDAVVAKLHHLPLPDLGELDAPPAFGDNLLLWGLRRLIVGPLGPHQQLVMHPMVLAGWFGLLVTMLNLIPIGQLDGGHVTYALFGPGARRVGQGVALVLVGLTFFASLTWVVWLLVATFAIGFGHPPVVAPTEPLTRGRKIVALVCAAVLILCFLPIPVRV